MAEHVVGPMSDFPPGTHRIVNIRNLAIGIFNIAGVFYALPNICPHQAGPLCAGSVNGTMIRNAATGWRHAWMRDGEILTCPWHGIEFDITTGRSLALPKLRVRQYAVTIEDGLVRISL